MTGGARTDAGEVADIDERLQNWRQGDIALANLSYCIARESGSSPVSVGLERGLSGQPLVIRGDETSGLVILSQTCDVVRSCALRPYVEVCPLVEVDDDTFASAKDGATPQFAYLPEIGSKYVADLGRVMSIHKSVLVSLARRAGWHADEEIRRFQAVIARRYQRFAFPNDLHASLSRLTNKLKRKHGREQSAEGTLFARVLQIRVKADFA